MDYASLKRLVHTLGHVKPIQLYYQLYYRSRSKWRKKTQTNSASAPKINFLTVETSVSCIDRYMSPAAFTFLNRSMKFESIDWNFNQYGKLWTYNLNYFEFLQQETMTREQGLALIRDFCSKSAEIRDGYEPYPISLRVMNWTRFLSKHKIQDPVINKQLYADLYRLMNQLEYHILANHLFENGFGLLFGAYFFQDEKLYKTAKKIIRSQLKEQILKDGAHYELAPMYHQIILHRILDSYQLVEQNHWQNHELKPELQHAAEQMLGWLEAIRFSDGSLPMVNDSTTCIAPEPDQLNAYAGALGLKPVKTSLDDSGYRKMNESGLEILIDVGQIAPSYQPGHAHADSLQLLLHAHGKPVLVDTGISTYEKNERRQLERSTGSHNTVTVDGLNSSEVWSGFRVGRRARVTLHKDTSDLISASHDGYRSLKLIHHRNVKRITGGFSVQDRISGNTNRTVEGHLHVAPGLSVRIAGKEVWIDSLVKFEFDTKSELRLETYLFCEGYNKLIEATKLVYTFSNETTFNIVKSI